MKGHKLIPAKQASVIVYTLMVLSVVIMLTQQLIRSVYIGSGFIQTMIDREKAQTLALSGVNVAIATLSLADDEEEKKEKPTDEKEQRDPTKRFMLAVLPHLNRWQEFPLREAVDGIDGSIRLCISCEQGKININEAFDFKKMEFKKEYDALLKALEIRGRLPAGELAVRITEYFKRRRRKLNEISELQTIPGLETLDIFYRPPYKASKGKKAEPNTELTLQDIFTLWSYDDKVDLLWLSDSLCAILNLRRPLADDVHTRQDSFKTFVQNFKKENAADWDQNWKSVEMLYGPKPKMFAGFKNIFSKEFGPEVFSVLSCGQVGNVEQYVLAVIRKEDLAEDATDKQKEQTPEDKTSEKKVDSPKKAKKMFRLLRVYWL